jgi:hypothetical protein
MAILGLLAVATIEAEPVQLDVPVAVAVKLPGLL